MTDVATTVTTPQPILAIGPGCCVPGSLVVESSERARRPVAIDQRAPTPDLSAFVRTDDLGVRHLHLFVENMQCAACIRSIESGLKSIDAVSTARVNMSTRRLAVSWRDAVFDPRRIIETVNGLGYPAAPFDPEQLLDADAHDERGLLSALAVAGFAATNVMLLSIAVWSGADMGAATRDLFHWISALIALPTVAYAGRPFFHSALAALRGGHLNMDVPISLAVLLAAAMSLHQTIGGREHAYFDASVMLLFFLLIGRYLDRRARAKARSTAEHLLALSGSAATVIDADGGYRLLPAADLRQDMIVHVAPGDRVPVDGVIEDGLSDLDTGLVTGESLPVSGGVGDRIFAGTMNLTGSLRVRVSASGEDTLLGEIVRLVENAEQGRARYVRLADRAARIYAPVVHILAAATFIGWLAATGQWEPSLIAAIAVLIITCPCALGLAVPVVQVVATGLLLRRGILVKSPDALERMAEIDTIIFDKTGTLTFGRPELKVSADWSETDLAEAAALARHSRHPLSRALVEALASPGPVTVTNVQETPGMGLAGVIDGNAARLGNRDWCGVDSEIAEESSAPELWLRIEGRTPIRFAFSDQLRPDAKAAIEALKKMGLAIKLRSGDRRTAVADAAGVLGFDDWRSGCLPADKTSDIELLTAAGNKVLMVGDGLNDAPALAAGHASMSPATAADVSQTAADLVFQGDRLMSVVISLMTARAATRLVHQNFALAVLYNVIAVPIAIAGLASPLVAAVAMSSSSLLVTLNALRLRLMKFD